MIDYGKIPSKGTMYAIYKDQVIYRKYDCSLEELNINESNLLELHLFDENREYRVIRSEVSGMIEAVISDDSCDYADIYEEIVVTEGDGKVTIANYITFTEEDTLMINNYRLKEVQ